MWFVRSHKPAFPLHRLRLDGTKGAKVMTTKTDRAGGRDRIKRLLVAVSADERAAIAVRAASVGMSVAAYLRAAALNQPLRCLSDRDAVDALARLHGELGLLRRQLAEQLRQGQAALPSLDLRQLVAQIGALQENLVRQTERLG
jgi:hypothetical protein